MRLLIVGASTRAAAWSAFRAGVRPVCADLFADRDLHQVADVIPVAQYPLSLPHDFAQVSTDAWMFVGAMENHRPILASLNLSCQFGTFCGPTAEATANLRNPVWLTERLTRLACYPASVVSPTVVVSPSRDSSARWLRKPLAGGGGRGIVLASPGPASSEEPCYWQALVEGVSLSALMLSSGGRCRCLMVSEQLIGCPEVAAPTPFTYCGSLGPWPVTPPQTDQLQVIAETLLDGLNYRGLLGLDLIWDGRRFWVIEVNPRYTASAELWEFSTGRSAVGEHLQAYDMNLPAAQSPPTASAGPILGKLILFADQNLAAPDLTCCLRPRDPWSLPWIADVPAADSQIPAAAPICTVYASANSRDECRRKLFRRAQRIRRWFDGSRPVRRGSPDPAALPLAVS